MAKNDINYHSLANDGNPFIEKPSGGTPDDFTTDTENEEPNRDGIIIHVVPDTSKGKCPQNTIFLTCQYYCVSKSDSCVAAVPSVRWNMALAMRDLILEEKNKAVC